MAAVGVQVLEEVVTVINDYSEDSNSTSSSFALPGHSIVRILRVLRLARIIRVFRVLRVFSELRTIVQTVVGSFKPLFWTVTLLFLIIYVVGVYVTQVVLNYRVDAINTPESKELEQFYGSLWESMRSLFQSITGGVDWRDMEAPLSKHIHPVMGIGFFAYISFNTLALMNAVTAILVEIAVTKARQDKDEYMVNQLRELIFDMDTDGSGIISWEEFEQSLIRPEMKGYFKAIEVDLAEAKGVFRLLDINNENSIHAEEFLSGCLRLRGAARSLDLLLLTKEASRMMQKTVSMLSRMSDFMVKDGMMPMKSVKSTRSRC